MRYLKPLSNVGLLSILLGTMSYASAAAPEDVTGLWRDDGSILWVEQVGETLEAKIIAFRPGELRYLEGEKSAWPVGTPRRDDQNPDPQLRARYLMGLNMLVDYRFDKGVWHGEIYDPRSGNTYSSTMKVNQKGELQMRGYIGIALLGRTVTYRPFDPCLSHSLALGREFVAVVTCTQGSAEGNLQ